MDKVFYWSKLSLPKL